MKNPVTGPVTVAMAERLLQRAGTFDALYLAVSGGADSLALMHLVADWSELGRSAGHDRPRLHVLTVDHGLRPEAHEEAQFVVAQARDRGLDGQILEIAEPAPKTGVQEWARDKRYDLLCAHVARDGRRAALVTAHHEGDVAETVLMRLARGSGVDGLAQIAEVTERGGVTILRPLLGLAKVQLTATLAARGITWIEDPSNASANFERVRLRQSARERAVLGLDDVALATTARRLRRARGALDAVADLLLDAAAGRERLAAAGVFEWRWQPGDLPDEIGIRLLTRALVAVGGTRGRLRLARIERLYAEIGSPRFAGATLGHCVVRPVQSHGTAGEALTGLEIYREPDRGALPVVVTDFSAPVIWDNRFVVECRGATGAAATVRGLRRGDLERVVGAERAAQMTLDDALRATPVVEEVGGGMALMALGLYRAGDGQEPGESPYRARFLVDRLYADRTGDGTRRKQAFARALGRGLGVGGECGDEAAGEGPR